MRRRINTNRVVGLHTRDSRVPASRARELLAEEVRALELQRELATSLGRQWTATRAPLLPGWQHVRRKAERASGFTWKGPAAIVLTVPDDGRGFACPEGKCDGRFEGMRIIFGDSVEADTMIVGVILLAESAMMSEDVWQHEMTHALLSQHGLVAESQRHDPRYFVPLRRAVVSVVRGRY